MSREGLRIKSHVTPPPPEMIVGCPIEVKIQGVSVIFVLDKKIEEGGSGSVWMASNQGNPALVVAIKIISRPKDGISRVLCDNFVTTEIVISNQVTQLIQPDTPFVEFFGHSHDYDYHYLVFEFIRGEDLFNHVLNDNYLTTRTESTIIGIMLPIVRFCMVLHKNNILHRDFKLANILLGDDGQVRLIDFGVATQSTATHLEVVGTPETMAPEVRVHGTYTIESEVFSIGSMTSSLISGSTPQDMVDFKRSLGVQEQAKRFVQLESTIFLKEDIDDLYGQNADDIVNSRTPNLIKLAALMMRDDPTKRPRLCEVERMLMDMESNTLDYL